MDSVYKIDRGKRAKLPKAAEGIMKLQASITSLLPRALGNYDVHLRALPC